ncbi:hypothetical protein ZEAMMB73_Zm00001d045868 [Zea mays]|uniref:ATP-dependent DNA helicase n=1 Tax=Zea mays TaxID=4577 RepID=A0A1D6NZK6_MAIZE|nr:hypothetical protein ZEAMMB73_Zm00001d045868 [Zea mays]
MDEVDAYRATHRASNANDEDAGVFNPILHGKRLFQQFAVDTYIKIESSCLDFIRKNQDQLRADLYQGLVDSMLDGDVRAEKVGKKYKLTCPEQYDLLISAEIPSNKYPELRKMVIKHMMHGPCGSLNHNCPCTKGRASCKNQYPRHFREATLQGKDSYPNYRRRDDGHKEKVRGCELDNRWVVPYNPYLLQLFNCHINVEACGSIKVVKYLFKYIYKGHDRASVVMRDASKENDDVDEIQQYRDARSMITAYFEANKLHEEVRGILYRDFPKWYTWQQGKVWQRRKQNTGGQSMGKDIKTFPLPAIIDTYDDSQGIDREIYKEESIEATAEDVALQETLNEEQKSAYEKILSVVDTSNGASIMPGGRTAHSRFKIQLTIDDGAICTFMKQSGTSKLLQKASLIIWDEASMAKRQSIEVLDNSMRDIMGRPGLPFGGKTIVFGGDFRQVLPIVPCSQHESKERPMVYKIFVGVGGGTEEVNNDGDVRLPDEHAGMRVFLPRIPLCPSDDEMFPFHFKRKQFPVRLSFAMTVNKSQGQTIPNVVVYLPEPVFSHGQLYVALSRAITRLNVKILVIPVTDEKMKKGVQKKSTINGVTYTKNIVYKEVLTP